MVILTIYLINLIIGYLFLSEYISDLKMYKHKITVMNKILIVSVLFGGVVIFLSYYLLCCLYFIILVFIDTMKDIFDVLFKS